MDIVDPRVDPALVPAGSRARIINGPKGDEYRDLPSIITPDGKVISRWTLTDAERFAIANGEDLYLTLWTGGLPVPPICLTVGPCDWND